MGLPSGDANARPRKRSHAAAKSGTAKKPEIHLDDSAVPGSVDPNPPPQSADAPPPRRGPTRIDFDDRLVQGQTNKSGAVYLYDRKELKTRSMVKKPESFREEIISAVYDSE
ncbi:MAG: hypothetical protein IRZ16_16065 [Myxococcaceae bacterium]|nr:hypothetical protein [Myxococcaceae bacterium]